MRCFADCHSCLPLSGDTDVGQLRLHYDAGVRYVSINIAMDMNPLEQIMRTIAGFRVQIEKIPWLLQAQCYADIETAFARNQLALSFDIEGALPLLGDANMVALYHRLGVRQIHLAYNRNNRWAGGAHDVPQGLTQEGETLVRAIHRQGILMDLSHNSEATARDICAISGDHPVLYSHANPRALVDHARNISDDMIRRVARTGGVVAINGVGKFIGDAALNPDSLVPLIEHVAGVAGIEHTAIGLDYCYDDGSSDIPETVDRGYWWPVSAGYPLGHGLTGGYVSPAGLTEIAETLARKNYRDEAIDAIMKGNILRLIRKVW